MFTREAASRHLSLASHVCKAANAVRVDSQDGHHHHHPRDAERPPEAAADPGQLHANIHDQQGLRRPVRVLHSGEPSDCAAVHHAARSAAVVQPVCASLADELWICACIGWIPSLWDLLQSICTRGYVSGSGGLLKSAAIMWLGLIPEQFPSADPRSHGAAVAATGPTAAVPAASAAAAAVPAPAAAAATAAAGPSSAQCVTFCAAIGPMTNGALAILWR